MATTSGSNVYLAVPVYHGADFVAGSLGSMLRQTHRDVTVMISVDGNDRESASACEPFLADERVRMVVQERQLGWVGNMNWLVDACDGDYFVYWQQDDHCEPDYLEKLVGAIERHPYPACAYSDLRWFGTRDDVASCPSFIGFAGQRILAEIDALHWIPLRGVVPTAVLRRAAPIRGLADSIAFSDYLFVLRLALHADMIRVPEVLYHKRSHRASASRVPSGDYHVQPREAWIDLGVQLFIEAAPRFDPADHPRLAVAIADRLVSRRSDRWFHYDAAAVSESEPAAVVAAFYAALQARVGVQMSGLEAMDVAVLSRWGGPRSVDERRTDRRLAGGPDRHALLDAARRAGRMHLAITSNGVADEVLLDGWALPESWGTWTDGYRARIWLPIPIDTGRWQVRFRGRPFAADGAPTDPRLLVSLDGTVVLDHPLVVGGDIPSFEVTAPQGDDDGVLVQLDLPDAIAPAEVGAGDDPRALSFALRFVELTAMSAVGAS